MSVYRTKIRWSGFTGAPGYTILHFDASTTPTQAGAQDVYDATATFASNLVSNLPTQVRLTTEAAVEVVDQTTNQLENIYNVTAAATSSGLASGGYSAAAGACIIWETGEVRNGRRVRGRTFVVPMSASLYETDGTLASAAITDLQQAASSLAGGGFSFGILARPTSTGAADGDFYTVSSGRVTDKTAILRSRRD